MQFVLQMIISGPQVGIMIPIPQYPLYSAAIALYGGQEVPYYLTENDSWNTSIQGLKNSLESAKAEGIDVKAMCVINPGNPTGQCLTENNMRQVSLSILKRIDYRILSKGTVSFVGR